MKTRTKYLIIFLICVVKIIFAFWVWHPDVRNHMDWGIRFWEYGPAKFYSANVWNFTWPNQPPGTIYLFAGVRKTFELVFSFFWFINIKIPLFPSGIVTFFEERLYPAFLQFPAIFADVGIAYLIYKVIKQQLAKKTKQWKKFAIAGELFFLINPAVWYNSAVWGQYDSLINFFALLAFYLLAKKKFFWAFGAMFVCLYIKLSLIIFLPIFVIYLIKKKPKIKKLIGYLIIWWVVFGIFTLPFSHGEPISWLFYLVKDKILSEQLHVITANAFNIWAALTGIHERPNSLLLGPVFYEIWGYSLFTFTFIPVLWAISRKQKTEILYWSLAITGFTSFMFLTNMHERYLYPLFPFLTIIVAKNPKLRKAYWAVSIISLINLYNFWWVPRAQMFIDLLSFGDRFLPRALGFVNFLLFIDFYKKYLRLL